MSVEHQLMTIKEAAEKLHSSVTASALHRARREQRLWAVKIGKFFYTTWPAVLEFLQCPDPESQHASTSAKTKSSGSFETERHSSGQDLALASAERLKRHSLTTSQAESHQSAVVRPIRQS